MNRLFKFQALMAVKHELREQGYGVFERRRLARKVTDEVMAEAVKTYADEVPKDFLVDRVDVAFGDGSLLKAILEWLGSPEGQNFIKFIIGLIMAIA